MAWSAKPKGDRAAILELEARCTGVGAGRRTPTVFRVPALYKDGWAGPVTRPRSRSVEPSAGSRRSLRRSSRSGTLSPLPDRAESRTSFQHGNWFASSLSDLESHWDDRTIFGIVRSARNIGYPTEHTASDHARRNRIMTACAAARCPPFRISDTSRTAPNR
jgi:hypothetical protein